MRLIVLYKFVLIDWSIRNNIWPVQKASLGVPSFTADKMVIMYIMHLSLHLVYLHVGPVCVGIYCHTVWRYWRQLISWLTSWWVWLWPMHISFSSQKHWPILLPLHVALELALTMLFVHCTHHSILALWKPGALVCTLRAAYSMLDIWASEVCIVVLELCEDLKANTS